MTDPALSLPAAKLPSGHAMDRRVAPPSWPRVRVAAVLGGLLAVLAALALTLPRGLAVARDELTLATVEAGTFDDELAARATVVPARSVLLDATDGGRVDAVLVADGAQVREGDLLFRLSNPQREQEVLARSADVAQQLANLSVQRAELAAARAAQRRELASLAYEQERADDEAGRTRGLAAQGFVAEAATRESERKATLQRRLLEQARVDGDAEMRTREQSLHELERAVSGLEEGLRFVRAAAAGLAARAPATGRLAGFSLQVGASVHSGDHLGRVDAGDGFKLSLPVDEFYRSRLRTGLAARTDAGATLAIARIDPQIANGRVGVELAFDGAPPAGLQAGQGVDVRLRLGDSHPALVVVDGPFYADTGGAWMYVLDAAGDAAERRPVRLGRRAAGRIEVLEGLRAGERVVVSGVRRYGDAPRLRLRS